MVTISGRSGEKLRYRWSRRHRVHRGIVRLANRVLLHVPFRVKCGATGLLRRKGPSAALLGPGSVAVQVGAPRDTLRSGRSRAMAFALRTRPSGRVLIVEFEPDSLREFRAVAAARGLRHVVVREAGAWSERSALVLEVDPGHPATSFTEGTAEYSDAERTRFAGINIDALPLDDIIEEAGLGRVDLVSITTNGAETQGLLGLGRTIERDRPHVSLARTHDSYDELMASLGYERLARDDRGFTFRHVSGPRE